MFKLTVDQVLESIKALSLNEKQELQARLHEVVLADPLVETTSRQTQTFGGINMTGPGNVFTATQSGGDSQVAQKVQQISVKDAKQQEVFKLLQQIRQGIESTNDLNAVEKQTAKVPLEMAENELKKQKPDKSIVDQAIAALKKGLSGVVELAAPVAKVAGLVAKAWFSV